MTPLDEFKQFPFDREKMKATHKGKVFRTYLKEVIVTDQCLKPVLEFLMKDYSANYTAKILEPILDFGHIEASSVIYWCRRLGVPTHNFSESARLQSCREFHEKTNLERYGAINTFSKGTPTYEKKLKTVKERYGVDNIRKSEVFQETRRKTMLDKYGVTNAIFLPTYERCTGRRSKLQQKVEGWLQEGQIQFEVEVPNKFRLFNEMLQKEYNPIVDILLEEYKLVIEVYGDRWHANPVKYSKSDIIPRWDGEVTAEHIWELDKTRTSQIESFGYRVIVLWENDIISHPEKTKQSLFNLICGYEKLNQDSSN